MKNLLWWFALWLVLISGVAGAYAPRDATEVCMAVHDFDALIATFELSLERAVQTRAAHPVFLDDLRAHLDELKRIHSAMKANYGSTDVGDTVIESVGEPALLAGVQTMHEAGSIRFNMQLVPAATFPTGTDDSGTAAVEKPFWIGETQVTYALWYTVRQWGLRNGYTFGNSGREGSHGSIGENPSSKRREPVTQVYWLDSIVWTNALSELLGFDPVYTYDENVIRDSTDLKAGDNAVQEDTNGFRLPTSSEWELAARYKGNDSSHRAIARGGLYWTPGNYASGATAPFTSTRETQEVAWYQGSGSTQDVGMKGGNALGVYDMSGNVWEWCFDWHPSFIGSTRVIRGGTWNTRADTMQVGVIGRSHPRGDGNHIGLRIARTAHEAVVANHDPLPGGQVDRHRSPDSTAAVDSTLNILANVTSALSVSRPDTWEVLEIVRQELAATLRMGDVPGSLAYFAPQVVSHYEQTLQELSVSAPSLLEELAQALEEAELAFISESMDLDFRGNRMAEYRVTVQDAVYHLVFVEDGDTWLLKEI